MQVLGHKMNFLAPMTASPAYGLVMWVNPFWVACNSLWMVVLDSKTLLSGRYQVRFYLSRVVSRWSGLKTNGDSVQLPVPATLSITRQHMGADNGCTESKPCKSMQLPEQTSKYRTDVKAFKGRRIQPARCNAQGQPYLIFVIFFTLAYFKG